MPDNRTENFARDFAKKSRSASLRRKIEDAVVVRFARDLHERYTQLFMEGKVANRYVSSAMGGQDRELADYLIEASNRFALIEFKADESAFVREDEKELRRLLASEYEKRRDLLDMGKKIHYAAWGVQRPITLALPELQGMMAKDIEFDRYPYRLCRLYNPEFDPRHGKQRNADQFIEDFLGSGLVGAGSERFKRYVQALFQIAQTDTQQGLTHMQGSVLVYAPAIGQARPKAMEIPFNGIHELFQMTLGHTRQMSHEQTTEQQRGSGLSR